jgi:methionyl-tRNA synthetase
MTTGSPFYVTTPIYYVNDRPHIGHVYTTTLADILARYHRLAGRDVFFLTGVDEHAAKVSDAAAERGLTAQQWADQNAAVFQQTFARLGIANDDFVRTSAASHKDKVLEYVAALLKSGDVYAGDYEGWYDAGQEEYVTESNAQASGYKSPINGKPLVRKKEKNYFFKLESYRAALLEHFQAHPRFVQPEARRNEIVNRIQEMKDVPISRTGTGGWGIPVPGDEQQTIYVWIDALFNYLSFIDAPERRKYWQAGAVHLIAKDILWFHAAIWPAMLMALRQCPGYDWVVLPQQVYAHSFWISEGQKMSKSLGNFIDLEKIDRYTATYTLDALRYFLASAGPLGTTDSDFAEAKFIESYNSALANSLGNCFSRVSNMTHRYFQGTIPEPAAPAGGATAEPVLNACRQVAADLAASIERLNLAGALQDILQIINSVDDYIERTQPFKMAKDPAKLPEVGTILHTCAEALRIASLLLWPVMPGKCEELWRRLGCDYAARMASNGGRGKLDEWARWGGLKPGTPILQGESLFPRVETK